jgi:hypothetical protein
VVEVLRKAEDRSAADQITALQEAIDQYSAGLPQADDLTAVLIVSR